MEKENFAYNQDIINELNKKTYKETFDKLTEKEQEKYFIFLYSSLDILYYLKTKDDEFIINFINNSDLSIMDPNRINDVLNNLKNKDLLFNIIDKLPVSVFEYYGSSIVQKLKNDLDRMQIINKIILKDITEYLLMRLLYSLECDKNKTKYFQYLSKYNQVEIIKKFTDLELQKEYVLKPEYSDNRSELVASVEDEQFIIEVFDKINVKKFRYNLIKRIDNLSLKEKLIYRLGDKSLTKFIETFNNEQDKIEIDIDVDSSITIGVELEACHKNINSLKVLKEMPYGFKIKNDSSVNSGFEIVSPILHYTKDDMNALNNICCILNDNSFYTDSSCGGHVHLGADYLENIYEYKMFLHLYCNFEDIIYLICNRQHSKCRSSVSRYASKTKSQYLKAVNEGFFEDEYENLDVFKENLIKINDNRYKGLNVKNLEKYRINTFEFRMANGEINFNELYHNIKLYARLLQVSKELANIKGNDPRNEYLNLLNEPLKQKDKLKILLSLLFKREEDRKFYEKRYKNNINILNNIIGDVKKDEVVSIVKPNTLVLKKD